MKEHAFCGNRRIRLLSLLLAILCLAAAAVNLTSCEKKPSEPASEAATSKVETVKVTLLVTMKDGSEKNCPVEIKKGATLKEAMLQAGILEESGIADGMINTVCGETADYAADSAYWALYENGEYLMTGAEATVLKDQATYGITYTVWNG